MTFHFIFLIIYYKQQKVNPLHLSFYFHKLLTLFQSIDLSWPLFEWRPCDRPDRKLSVPMTDAEWRSNCFLDSCVTNLFIFDMAKGRRTHSFFFRSRKFLHKLRQTANKRITIKQFSLRRLQWITNNSVCLRKFKILMKTQLFWIMTFCRVCVFSGFQFFFPDFSLGLCQETDSNCL